MLKFLKNKKINNLILLVFLVSLFCFFQIQTVQAGLVPCGLDSDPKNRCTLCHLIVGIKGIIEWGRNILVVVAMVAIVAGGIMYIVSAGNNSMMESAKNVIKQALWGVVIVLGAWVIVNTAMWLLATKLDNVRITSWYEFDCTGGVAADGDDGTETGGDGTVLDGATTCTEFIYSGWSACRPNGTQTRSVTSQRPSGCSGGTPGPLSQPCPYTGGPTPAGGIVPTECKPHESAFDTASGGDINKKCLLVGIARRESGCNANIVNSSKGACGIMQMKPSTANMTCEALSANPGDSIQRAAEVFDNYKAEIEAYRAKYGYNIGVDDAIAAYNAGPGDGVNLDGTRQPFNLSLDCPSPPTPAWQCPINPGGFDETQNYVRDVQGYQNECLGN